MKEKSINLRHVPVSMRRALFAFLFFSAWATPNLCAEQLESKEVVLNEQSLQSKQTAVSGVVTDASGEPLIGVSVKVKGATVGTATDIDGKFSLNVPSTSAVLVFSYVGYATQDITVGSKTTFDIVMEDDSKMLDQVVVTALGIKKDKKALGYSVSSVSSDDITKAGSPLNAMSSLYGKASGLQIGGTSGGPTGGMVMKIRNAVSLTEESNTRPLIVVDGIPIKDENTNNNQRSLKGGGDRGTGINDIPAEDIASIEILKGAKAAVLYGAEGANGVVLITTKNGTQKKGLGIDFSANYAIVKAAYGPEFQNEYGLGQSPGLDKNANISSEGFYQQSIISDDGLTTKKVDSYWQKASGNFGPAFDGRSLLSWDGTYRPYRAYKDNYKDMYRTGGQSSVNLALNNSGEMGSFRVGYNFKDYKSIIPGATNYTHTFSFNGNLKANEFVTIKASTSFSQNRDKNAPYRIQDMTTYGIPRDLDMNEFRQIYVNDGYDIFRSPELKENFPAGVYLGDYFWNQEQDLNDYKRNHLIQSLGVDVKFNDNLSWNSLGGIDYTVIENEVQGKFQRPITENALQGYYGLKSFRNATYYAQSHFNADYDIASKWNLSGFVGGAVKRNIDEMQNTYIEEQFAVENYFSFTNTTNPEGPHAQRERGKDLLLSLYASAQLAYDNQIYLEVQGRNDWSSILPKENNSYFYPGMSLSWIISETLRNQLPSIVQFAKLRTSWADVGRPGPRYYGNVSFKLGSFGNSPTLSMPSYLPPANYETGGGFPVPDLKPERKREFEVGFETSLFQQNRLSLDFSWYTNNTYNQIVTLPVAKSSGVDEVRLNAGNIAQKGLEFSINSKPIITKDFVWTVGVNFANYTTKIKELAKGINEQILWSGTSGVQVTAPIGGKYGEIWVRPYATDETTGERMVNNEGVWYLDQSKWKKVGKTTPDVIGGLNTSLTYKGFSLSANFDFQFGATMISQTNMYLLGNGSGKESLKYRDEAHGGLPYYMNQDGNRIQLDSHNAAVPADSYYPFIMHDGVVVSGVTSDGKKNENIISAQKYYTTTYWKSGMEMSEDMFFKSDYISLRQISLSYDVPKSVLNKAKIQGMRLTLFGNNLAYIYKDIPNTTPESSLGTNDNTEANISPSTRSFGIGINLSF